MIELSVIIALVDQRIRVIESLGAYGNPHGLWTQNILNELKLLKKVIGKLSEHSE